MKLDAPGQAGASGVTRAEKVSGWCVGDRVFLTGTTRQSKHEKTFKVSVRLGTEERTIAPIDGTDGKMTAWCRKFFPIMLR